MANRPYARDPPLHTPTTRFVPIRPVLSSAQVGATTICIDGAWSHLAAVGCREPYAGQHYQLGRTLNSPQSVQRPHPPILIGGSGEKQTLRLVAEYADACNLFDTPDVARKLDVLREHCSAVGRDYDEIEKTVMSGLNPGESGEHAEQVLTRLQELAALGVTHVHTGLRDGSNPAELEVWGEHVIPEASRL